MFSITHIFTFAAVISLYEKFDVSSKDFMYTAIFLYMESLFLIKLIFPEKDEIFY